MNKPLALILSIAASLPIVGCTESMPRRDTVFHQTDESPRTGAMQRSQRYGFDGTHSPNDRSGGNRSRNNNPPSNPDGIVKPDTLDGNVVDPGVDPGMVDSGTGTGDPGIGSTDPAPAPSGEAPYAEAVPGKYGLVYSPFVKNKKDGLVNVTDENNVPLPPGTEVTDPHTGKIFRVP